MINDHEPECYVYEKDCCPWIENPPCQCQCICDILISARNRGYKEGWADGFDSGYGDLY